MNSGTLPKVCHVFIDDINLSESYNHKSASYTVQNITQPSNLISIKDSNKRDRARIIRASKKMKAARTCVHRATAALLRYELLKS